MTDNVVPLKVAAIAEAPSAEAAASVPDDFYFMTPEYEQVLATLPIAAEYNKEVVLVYGSKGCGKTTLLKQYLKENDQDWDLCLIRPHHVIGEKHLLAELNQAFFPGNSFSVKDFIEQLAGGTELLNHPLVIIDDAQNLSSFALEVLFSIKHAVEARGARLSIVLLADETIQTTLSTPSLLKFDATLRIIEMPSLTEEQAGQYLRHCLKEQGIDKQQFLLSATLAKSIYRRAQGMPAHMNSLLALAVERHIQLEQWPLWRKYLSTSKGIAGLVSVSLVIVIMLAVVIGEDEDKDALEPPAIKIAKATIAQYAEQMAAEKNETVLAVPQEKKTKPLAAAVQSEKASPQKPVTVVDKKAELPKPVVKKPVTQKPIVQTPVVKTPLASTPVVAPQSEPTSSATTAVVKTPVLKENKPVLAAVIKPRAEVEKPTARAVPVQGNDWLMKQDGQFYTIQLSASAYEDAIIRFIKRQAEAPDLHYVHVIRRGQDWYAVLYGAYSSVSQAREIIEELPQSLLKNDPWVRRISAIQKMLPKPVLVNEAEPSVEAAVAVPAAETEVPAEIEVTEPASEPEQPSLPADQNQDLSPEVNSGT